MASENDDDDDARDARVAAVATTCAPCELRPRAFFVAWSGVLALASPRRDVLGDQLHDRV